MHDDAAQASLAKKARIDVVIDIVAKLQVHGDKDQLQMVLFNLISNALDELKRSPDRRSRLRFVSHHQTRRHGRRIMAQPCRDGKPPWSFALKQHARRRG